MATWGSGNFIGVLHSANDYGTGTLKYDISEVVDRITPLDTPFYNMIGDGQAMSALHQWLTEELRAPGPNSAVEGGSLTPTTPPLSQARQSNLVQTLKTDVAVSRLSQKFSQYAISDPFQHSLKGRMEEWKLDCELALLKGTLRSGVSGTAAQMQGAMMLASTSSATVSHSGTSFTVDRLAVVLQNLWAIGAKPRDVIVGGNGKRRISSFTAGATKFFNQDEKKLIQTVSVFEGDFSMVEVHPSRFMRDHATTASDVLIVTRSAWRKAWVDKPFVVRPPEVNDRLDGVILGDLTLECGTPSASAAIVNTFFVL